MAATSMVSGSSTQISMRSKPIALTRSMMSSVLLEKGETQINVLAPYLIARSQQPHAFKLSSGSGGRSSEFAAPTGHPGQPNGRREGFLPLGQKARLVAPHSVRAINTFMISLAPP